MNFHSFADDMQTYLHYLPGDVDSVVCQLERCIREIGHWMSANRLKLNTDKTELLWTGSRHHLSLLGGCGPSVQLGDDVIKPSDHVRHLGVTILRRTLVLISMSQMSARHASFGFRQLRRVRRSLDIESVKTFCPCLCHIARRLLQLGFVFCAKDHGQVAACSKCCGTSGHRDPEI